MGRAWLSLSIHMVQLCLWASATFFLSYDSWMYLIHFMSWEAFFLSLTPAPPYKFMITFIPANGFFSLLWHWIPVWNCNICISITCSSEEAKIIHYLVANVAVVSEKLSHLTHSTPVNPNCMCSIIQGPKGRQADEGKLQCRGLS